jgi:hypothetical protein
VSITDAQVDTLLDFWKLRYGNQMVLLNDDALATELFMFFFRKLPYPELNNLFVIYKENGKTHVQFARNVGANS